MSTLPYLRLTVWCWLARGERERGEGMSGFCHRIFRALYSAPSEGPSQSHTASAPFPNTAVFLRGGRHRAEPRNWISAPCDTCARPWKRCFITEINRLLLGTRVLCLSGQSYLSARAGEEKQGPANGSHSLPVLGEEEQKTGKPKVSQSGLNNNKH